MIVCYETVGAAKEPVLAAELLPISVLAKMMKFRSTFATLVCNGSPFHMALAERRGAVGTHTGRHCCRRFFASKNGLTDLEVYGGNYEFIYGTTPFY